MDISKIKERFAHFDALARKLYPEYARMPVPRVIFTMKGRLNGQAFAQFHPTNPWTVQFNHYIAGQVGDAFDNTISHEIAHMVDFIRRGKSGHDRIWKSIHAALGGTAKAKSRYGANYIGARVSNWYVYRTPSGGELVVGPRHHNALRSGKYDWISSKRTGEKVTVKDWTGEIRKK